MKHLALGIDLVFCLIVLPLMAALSPIERWVHHFTAYMLLAAAWLYAVYIANRTWAVPLLFGSRRKKVCGVLIVLASLASAFLLTGIELYEPKPNIHDAGIERRLPQVLQYQQALWTLFMLTEAFSFAVGLLVQADLQRARRRAAEAAKDRAEIELYKAQIKPHFMFNTLNSLYGLFLTGSERALPSLEKFIQMMKYVHLSSARTLVPLSEEAEYIRRYADVQSLRLGETAKVHLDISVPPCTLTIPPMLLATFVENCFKHGVSPVERSDLRISLAVHGRSLLFTATNRILPCPRRIGEHMGIDNCRKRLDLHFPGKYRLYIGSRDGIFSVRLRIDY